DRSAQVMEQRARGPCQALRAAPSERSHVGDVLSHGGTGGKDGPRTQALDMSGAHSQPTVFVEVAAHELSERVIASVQDSRSGNERLLPTCRHRIPGKCLILRVLDFAKPNLLPALPRNARVDVREEAAPGIAVARRVVHAGGASIAERGKELFQLPGDHRARAGARPMRAERETHSGVDVERRDEVRKPASVSWCRVLCEECDPASTRSFGGKVPCASVTELFRRYLDHARARPPRNLDGNVT